MTTVQTERQNNRRVGSAVVMTGITLTLLGSVVIWQLRPPDVGVQPTVGPTEPPTIHSAAKRREPPEGAPIGDQEAYQRWQERHLLISPTVVSLTDCE